jgi:hypothetical protein
VRIVYHSGNCSGHVLAPGESAPPLSACRQYPGTFEEHARRDPRFNPQWREVLEADRDRK